MKKPSQRGIVNLHLAPSMWCAPTIMACGVRVPLPKGESYTAALKRVTCAECRAVRATRLQPRRTFT